MDVYQQIRDQTRSKTERRVLSAIQRHGPLASAEIARQTGLSAQSASVITRALEADHLLQRGAPAKGKIGKPSIPMSLNPNGVLAYGLKIGRRTADLVLLDFCGRVQGHRTMSYDYPTPERTMHFLREGIAALGEILTVEQKQRLCGIGVAAPFELWNWLDIVNAPKDQMIGWRGFSFQDAIARFSDLPVAVANDATLACSAEQVFGSGRQLSNFAYFFIGAFIGGGVVLDGRVWPGPRGNAGAFGSIPVRDTSKPGHQLIHNASVYTLEQALERNGANRREILNETFDWAPHQKILDDWLTNTAGHIATATVAIAAVLDTSDVVIDSILPKKILDRLTAIVPVMISRIDIQGISEPSVRTGTVGRSAGAIGAAYLPIASRFLTGGTEL